MNIFKTQYGATLQEMIEQNRENQSATCKVTEANSQLISHQIRRKSGTVGSWVVKRIGSKVKYHTDNVDDAIATAWVMEQQVPASHVPKR